MSDTGTERIVFVTSLLHFRNPSFRLSADSLQLMPFLRRQLRALRGKDFGGGDLAQFPWTRLPRDQSDFPHRGLSRLPLLELFDFAFDFLPPFGKTLAERVRDPFDLKTGDFAVLPCLPDAVAQLPHSAGHLVLIDLARVADGPDHFVFAQRIPFPVPVASGIGDHKMGVKLRIESAAGIVGESRRANVPGDFRPSLNRGVLLPRGELLQFAEGDPRRTLMGRPEARVPAEHRQDRHRLLRRALEIKERHAV